MSEETAKQLIDAMNRLADAIKAGGGPHYHYHYQAPAVPTYVPYYQPYQPPMYWITSNGTAGCVS